jgi:hypothetical protein
MTTLKNVLAAFSLAEIIYILATLMLLIRDSGISSRKTTGIGAVVNAASSPLALSIGIVSFMGALFLFVRYK